MKEIFRNLRNFFHYKENLQQELDMLRILPRPVLETDYLPISILLNTAFDGPSEARLVERLRADGDMALELVSENENGLVGYIAFARMSAPEGFWTLSPVAVRSSLQGNGLGKRLIVRGLDEARRAGAKAVVVLGAPEYYKRFGFSVKAAEGLETPYSKEHTLLYPIAQGTAGAKGPLAYPPAFAEL